MCIEEKLTGELQCGDRRFDVIEMHRGKSSRPFGMVSHRSSESTTSSRKLGRLANVALYFTMLRREES